MAPRERLSADEKKQARDFLLHLVEWSGKKWDQVVYEAGIPPSTAAGWRYARATPEMPGLLRMMRAAGLLSSDDKITVSRVGSLADLTRSSGALHDEAAEELRRQSDEPGSARAHEGGEL